MYLNVNFKVHIKLNINNPFPITILPFLTTGIFLVYKTINRHIWKQK